MAIAYVALGSNLGDRLALLRAATDALASALVRVVGRSPVYETPAVADQAQPPYLNAVLRLDTQLGPGPLLQRCLAIETALGRTRPHPRAPRTIDLDLLLHGHAILDLPDLVLPHPRLLERAFVRVPLAQVATPGLRHPGTGEPLDRFPAPADVRMVHEAAALGG